MRCSIERLLRRTHVDDLLLSALVRALQPWTGRPDVLRTLKARGEKHLQRRGPVANDRMVHGGGPVYSMRRDGPGA
jgi:hypothetical protein